MKRFVFVSLAVVFIGLCTAGSVLSNTAEISCTTHKSYVCLNELCTALEFSDTTVCSDKTGHGSNGVVEVPSGYFIGNTYITEYCAGQNCCKVTEFVKDGTTTARASSFNCLDDFHCPDCP